MADSAEEALEKARRFEPSLILLDRELKGLKCLSLLPELLVENPDASVVLLANRPKLSSVVETMTMGAVDFFERPLDLERLKLVIEHQKALFESQTQPRT
jgi:DNA-binding NtrC family response regulator